MPTTREVEAARVERRRKAAEQQAATPPRPTSAAGRRAARAEAAHRANTAGAAWRCKVETCPQFDVWQVPEVNTAQAAERAADQHYARNHYRPQG